MTPEQKTELFRVMKEIGPETRLEAQEDLREAFKRLGWELPEMDVRLKLVNEYMTGNKPKRTTHHSGNKVLKPAVAVSQDFPRRDLKGLYPGYTIDARGDVWTPDGERATPRFRRKQEWVYLYDADNRRKERSVYWLMELVGFVDESRKPKEKPKPFWHGYNNEAEYYAENPEE